MSNTPSHRPFEDLEDDVDFDVEFLNVSPDATPRPDALAGSVEVDMERPPEWGLPGKDEPTEWVALGSDETPDAAAPAAAFEATVADEVDADQPADSVDTMESALATTDEFAADEADIDHLLEPEPVSARPALEPLTVPDAVHALLASIQDRADAPPLPPLEDAFGGADPLASVVPVDDAIADTFDVIDDGSAVFPEGGDVAASWSTGAFSALATQDQADATAVPRIMIHVFAEREETLAAAERAGQDRRLSRATTQIRVGGVQAAIDAYRSEPTPPLVIVECSRDPQALLQDVDQLANVCDAGTKVIVIGATNDIILFRELMRRGVSEYLVAPVQPLQLISAIGGLFADPAQPFIGRTVAFVGARGGAGASVVAHNTAYAITERIGSNAVIVDYDLAFGTAGLDFNQDPVSGVADALSQPDRLDAVLLDRMVARCTDKLSLFAAPATLDNDWDVSPDAFEEVTNRIRSTAPFVVLDLPHLWSGWMKKTLISADEVVVVATPDLASLRNAKNIVDLVKQARPNDAPPRLVLNQVGVPGRPEIPAKEFGDALGIHPSMIIPFDAKLFGQAANNGQMILDAGAKSKPAESFQTLAEIVTRREAPQPAAKPAKEAGASLFSGLFKKKAS